MDAENNCFKFKIYKIQKIIKSMETSAIFEYDNGVYDAPHNNERNWGDEDSKVNHGKA